MRKLGFVVVSNFNPASRKWLITINNPVDRGFTHDVIKDKLSSISSSSLYWCMCDEQGDECETLHTHLFIYRKSHFRLSTIDNLFHGCHQDRVHGTPAENRAYVLKDGAKFNKDSDTGKYHYVDSSGKVHDGINFSNTFEEFGICPEEHQGKSSASETVVQMIKDGFSNEDIVDVVPSSFKDLEKVERTRSMYRDSKFRDSWRNLHVTYIFGKTGSGKTRGVMEQYGYSNCYRVTDYKHPFDTYDGQDVIIFEEFRGGLKHGDMLNYLDGYPLLLPCRYFNRQACFTKVYIISNIAVDEQYQSIDGESRQAFFRRIHEVVEYTASGKRSYDGVQAYLDRYKWVDDIERDWSKNQIHI